MANIMRNSGRSIKFMFSGKTFKLPSLLRRHRRRDSRNPDVLYSPTFTPSASTSTSLDFSSIFHLIDADNDGNISSDELHSFFLSIGDHDTSAEELKRAVGEKLDYDDFVRLMETTEEGDIRRAFEMFETEKGSGFITPDGLRIVLRQMGEMTSAEDCRRMIRVYDVDGDGVVDYGEFRRMMLTTCG